MMLWSKFSQPGDEVADKNLRLSHEKLDDFFVSTDVFLHVRTCMWTCRRPFNEVLVLFFGNK